MEQNDIEAAKELKDKLEKYDIMNCHESTTTLLEKYPFSRLRYLSFIMTEIHEFFDRKCLLLEYTILKYPRLNALDVEFWLNLPGIYCFVEEIGHTDRAYRQRLPELMPRIIPRIKNLKTRPKSFENFVDIMRPISSHLREVTFYTGIDNQPMFRSLRDLFYIQSLTHLTSLSVQTRGTEYLFNDDVILSNTKHLSIFDKTNAEDPKLILVRLLFAYNGLETFAIESHTTRVSVVDTSKEHPSVVEIRFVVQEIVPEVKNFIRIALPRVTRIHWHTIENPRVSIFEFPRHTLSTFNLVFFNERFKHSPNRPCNIHYHITRNIGTKQLNYSVLGIYDKKATENNYAYPMRLKVQIVCKELWHLMDQNVVIS